MAEYAESMLAGDEFPPLVVFQSRDEFVLADGFHRLRAASCAKFNEIVAEIRLGTRIDALRHSLAANHTHGLRRTTEDKRYAVTVALREFRDWSDRMIADVANVSHPLVAQMRRQLEEFPVRRTGRDGKIRALPQKSLHARTPPVLSAPGPAESADGDAHRDVMEVGRLLKEAETKLKECVARHPGKKALLRGILVKARDDISFLIKSIG